MTNAAPEPDTALDARPDACPYCGSEVELVGASAVYPHRPELAGRHVWRCTACDAHVGCHAAGTRVQGRDGVVTVSDGTLAMGSLANKELRAARIETHRLFDVLWQPPARMSRREAYAWMARVLKLPQEAAHIASLGFDECVQLMHAIEDLTRLPNEAPPVPDAARWLTQAGIGYAVEADGHLTVQAHGDIVDYWPDSDSWSVRSLAAEAQQGQQGLHGLILFCKQRRRR